MTNILSLEKLFIYYPSRPLTNSTNFDLFSSSSILLSLPWKSTCHNAHIHLFWLRPQASPPYTSFSNWVILLKAERRKFVATLTAQYPRCKKVVINHIKKSFTLSGVDSNLYPLQEKYQIPCFQFCMRWSNNGRVSSKNREILWDNMFR